MFGISLIKLAIYAAIAVAVVGFVWGVIHHIEGVGREKQKKDDAPIIAAATKRAEVAESRATTAEGANASLQVDLGVLRTNAESCSASVKSFRLDTEAAQNRSALLAAELAANRKQQKTQEKIDKSRAEAARATLPTENACAEADTVLRGLADFMRKPVVVK